MSDYLTKIINSRVYDVAVETPLEEARVLSKRLGCHVYLKREDLQSVFSFKLRGAYNKIANLSREELDHGIICASAGNHAQGVALAASKLGCRAVIAMPETTPPLKVNAVREKGGSNVEVLLFGASFSDTYKRALEVQKEQHLTFVHPFDDELVIAGQGTIGMEIIRRIPKRCDAVFVPVGGGGLIAGVAAFIKAVRPDIKVYGVETADSCAMKQSLDAGKPVELKEVGLFSDGTAVKLVGSETFRLCQKYVEDVVIVSNDDVCAAIRDVFLDTRNILEPAGALSVAGVKKVVADLKDKGVDTTDYTFVAVTSGANMNFDRLEFVASRASIGETTEALFAVTIEEKPGSFKNLCSVIVNRYITEFSYRISDTHKAHVFIGISVNGKKDVAYLTNELKKVSLQVFDVSDDEVAKSHLRHMVGGRSRFAANELLYRFEFPERPGALSEFLDRMSPKWNISLFHFRNHGYDYNRVLVGFQVPPADMELFRTFLESTGYVHWDESKNPIYPLFL